MPKKKEVGDILDRYKDKLEGALGSSNKYLIESTFSREYDLFKEEMVKKETTKYEKWCNKSEKIIGIRPGEKALAKLTNNIETTNLSITPQGAMSFGVLIGLGVILLGLFHILLSFILFSSVPIFFPLLFIIGGLVAMKIIGEYPNYLASRWRLKATNQMVMCVLYIVMYMRHTSNLEHAIKFAAQHIGDPLSKDLKKIFWDVETNKFSTIKESLDNYLENWKEYSPEFVESLHLIESSLYESSDKRRLELLDKGLEVILEGTYEKMLHYAHDLKSPITILHMLGVVLPILGLVIFPLVSSFMGGSVKWYHLAFLYNIILPLVVVLVGMNILSKRPTGYGETEINLDNPNLMNYTYYRLGSGENSVLINPKKIAWMIAIPLILLGLLPVIAGLINPIDLDFKIGQSYFLGYNCEGDSCIGPYGVGAMMLGFLIPLGIALGLGTYYRIKTKKLMVIRKESKRLEKEFSGSLFQLGNRIEDGMPVELAFGRVAENMEGTVTGSFFFLVSNNIIRLGMSVKEALFNPKVGAVYQYPSAVISSSMKILLGSIKKGPKIAAKSIISISNYMNRIHKINERLRDLLADIISSMKGQVSFLTPIIAGIVVGIGSMITNIIGMLSIRLSEASAIGTGEEIAGISPALIGLFNIRDVIPSFYLQLVVGLYVVEITIILSMLANGIENGPDKLAEKNSIGKNLYIGTTFYLIVAFIVTLLFNLLAAGVLAGVTT